MPIDDCKHTFDHLAATVLPGYMVKLREAMKNPVPASLFAEPKQGPKAIAKLLQRDGDFAGCYVFLDNGEAKYVGISRKVLTRLRQHLCGKTHFDASLAYRMAKDIMPTQLQRKDAMQNGDFRNAFDERQEYLRSLHVSFLPLENDLEIYLFEAFCAMALDTSEWNTFRTH